MPITSFLSPPKVQQQDFAAAILARRVDAAPLQALFVGAPEHITQRLAVYRANLQTARLSALRAAFPTVEQLVGAEFFAGLAREYGFAHPSANGNLNYFGAAFAEFIRAFEPVAALPYLPDVARLDWALHLADSAADAAPLTATSLAQAIHTLGAERFTLILHPSLAVLSSDVPLWDIWQYNEAVRQGTAAAPITDWSKAQTVLVHRQGFRALPAYASFAEAAALLSLQQGLSLQAALSAALHIDPALDIAQLLQSWTARELLTKHLPL